MSDRHIAVFSQALKYVSGLAVGLLAALIADAQVNVTTTRNDIGRTGLNPNESILTPANVNTAQFGKVFAQAVDGEIYAQPLYVSGLTINGVSHNVVFVATEHDSVYAFDADSTSGTNTSPLWQASMLTAAHGAGPGATTMPWSVNSDIYPEVGIEGTPVIDPATGTLYVVAKTIESGNYILRLHALDITTGAEKLGGPVSISASVPGTGSGTTGTLLPLRPQYANNRTGLLLLNGIVYIAFGSHEDITPWHGWVLGYNATTLQQTGKFCSTPNDNGGGIWMIGTGLAADQLDPAGHPYGRIFAPTGNGGYDATQPYGTNSMDYADSILNLDLSNGSPTVTDEFTPSAQADYEANDVDVASGGLMILPTQPGPFPNLLVQVGKSGTFYILNRESLGGYHAVDQVVQTSPTAVAPSWSSPGYWNNKIYFAAQRDTLKSYPLANGQATLSTPTKSSEVFDWPGATPSISANGNTQGVVWTIDAANYVNHGPSILRAHNANNVATTLYSSATNAARDGAGPAVKFAIPTVANGKVYVGTGNQLDVYGLLSASAQTSVPSFSPASGSYTAPLSVTITDATANSVIYYTTDGSPATISSNVYTGPIQVTSSPTTLNAIATSTGLLASSQASATYSVSLPPAATPTFSPAAGTYNVVQSVTLSDSTAGAKIYYTTDGSTPTTSSAVYSSPIAVSSTTTIKAIATANGFSASTAGTATYTLVLPPAASPTFSPAGGTFATAQTVTLSDTTAGATIRYTLDGTTPTTSSPVYSAPISINTTQTVKAIATANGFSTSAVGSASYTIGNTTAPVVNFPSGFTSSGLTFNGGAIVSGGGLLVTDGGAFEGRSIWYSSPVNVQAFTTDFTFQLTAATADGFTFAIQNAGLAALGGAGGALGYQGIGTSVAVKFDLFNGSGEGSDSTGFYVNGAMPDLPAVDMTGSGVDLHSGHQMSAHLVYDGTTLTLTVTDLSTSATFTTSKAINIPATAGATIAYVGFTGGTGGSAATQKILTWTYSNSGGSTTPVAASPTFSPAAGTYTSAQNVTLSDTTAGATIYYTTDGSTPTATSAVYSSPIAVNSTQTIKAIAAASGYTASSVASAAYTVNITQPTVATPAFSPAPGNYTTAQSVTLSDSTAAATIYYTTNGATPTTASTIYSAPIPVNAATTIKAMATASGYSQSAVATAAYTIGSTPPPVVNFPSGFASTSGLSLNGGATISGGTLVLTDGGYEARSVWYSTPVNVQTFTTDFTFQLTAATADGFTFAIQNTGLTALGGAGSSLGYGGIGASVAVKFDLYNGSGEGSDSTGFYVNGASPDLPAVDMTSSGIDLHSGDQMTAHLAYDGATLTLTITDLVSAASFTTSKAINIPATVGANTAYVGFSAGTGGLSANQAILSWTYNTSGTAPSVAAAPTFSPTAGTYTSAQNVTLTDTTAGAIIYYTTNGSTPTTASTVYGGPIAVNATTTVKAIAAASGYTNSAVAASTYTITVTQPTAATPTFTPAAGSYTAVQSITLADTTSGATIYYTTNGSTPTTASAVYSGPIAVNATTTVKAIAAAAGFATSAVASATYTITLPKAATPTFTPAAGSYTSVQSVTISDATAGATIYYTTNGSTPTTASTVYSGLIPVNATTTLKAIATAVGFATSAVASATYTITLPKAATPTFSPAAGTYSAAQNVSLSDTAAGATIYYTTDGTTPTTASIVYTAPIAVNGTQTIKAIATASGFSTSAVGSAAYTINLPKAATPTFTPAPGSFPTTQSVTINDTTSGALIFYTLDGSTPTTASALYSGPISVSTTETIKAIASATGFSTSAVAAGSYTIGTSTTPVVNYPSGFTGTSGLTFNGGAVISGTSLVMSDGGGYEDRSVWTSTQVNVQKFTTDFNFQLTAATADGFTFAMQNVGPTALGGAGSGLGYAGIGTSVAVKFDLFNGSGEGSDSTGFYINGASPDLPAVDMTGSGVDLHSADPMSAHLVYDGTTLTLTITDLATTATFTTSKALNIPATVGGNNAYVGFTAGTGGASANQNITSWTYRVN
jgi:hypothetical protein